MYTKARIAGHSIHPMLVSFPVALYVSTVVCLFVFGATADPFWFRAALWANIAGVAMAALAAIPGIIDLVNLPAGTRTKITGARHAAFNALSLFLFAGSALLLYRQSDTIVGVGGPLVMSILGLASTVVAGWLGWTMVQVHHVGIRPTQPADVQERLTDNIDDLDEVLARQQREMPGTYVETYRTPIR